MLEEIGVFYRGTVLGVMIAAPVGPIGLLCIRRTIQKGLLMGFFTGLGAAFADAFFGAVAAFSVSAILEFLHSYEFSIRMLGGFFLLIGAWHTWHDKPESPETAIARFARVRKVVGITQENTYNFSGIAKAVLGSFAITMTNPATIVAVLTVVATFGELRTDLDAYTIVAGIFAGSTLWWVLLSGGVALVRGHFTESRVVIINRFTAVMLAGIGVWALVSGIRGFFGI